MEVRVLKEVIGIAGGCECLHFSPVHPQITRRLGGFRRQWFYHTCGSWGNEEVSQHWFSLVSAAGAELGTERIACGASGPFPLDCSPRLFLPSRLPQDVHTAAEEVTQPAGWQLPVPL